MKLVMGQLRPSEGRIRVLGEAPWRNVRLYRRIGFCPEYDAFYNFLNALEFVALLARMHGMPRHEARDRAAAALERVGATQFMERKIGSYSKGMRQRTKLAQALVHDPDFIVLDEPLSGLDPVGRHELLEIMRALGAAGKSVLVSSHVLHEVQEVTDEFLLIYHGRVLASGNVREIRGLIDKHPHQITIRCDRPRELARHLLDNAALAGIELDPERGSVVVRTREPSMFYRQCTGLVAEHGHVVSEVRSDDDNLEAVFKYLVGE
jgi:ABC-2 type transport system ATP-binding protein